jgi:hypothetical protein
VAHMKQDSRDGTRAFVHSVSRSRATSGAGGAGGAAAYTPLSPLDSFSLRQIETHFRALQAETFQRRFRAMVVRLMDHSLNSGMFNAPVDPVKFGVSGRFRTRAPTLASPSPHLRSRRRRLPFPFASAPSPPRRPRTTSP